MCQEGLPSYLDSLDKRSWCILLFHEDVRTYCASRQTNKKKERKVSRGDEQQTRKVDFIKLWFVYFL